MMMPYIETEIITRKQIIADSLRLATWHFFFVSWCKGQLILMHLYIGCVHIFCSNLWPQRKNGEKWITVSLQRKAKELCESEFEASRARVSLLLPIFNASVISKQFSMQVSLKKHRCNNLSHLITYRIPLIESLILIVPLHQLQNIPSSHRGGEFVQQNPRSQTTRLAQKNLRIKCWSF